MEWITTVLEAQTPFYILLRMAIILVLTHLLAQFIVHLSERIQGKKLYYKFIFNVVFIGTYVTGILTALGQLPGFDTGFSTLMAGSGIAALTIGLAAQESLGNAINGMVISVSKPFEVGDRIKLLGGNITGYVEDITLRHTVIRTFMNSRIIIPNSTINNDMVENSNFVDTRASAFVDCTIPYDANMELAESIMAHVIGEHPNYVDYRTEDQMNSPKVPIYIRALSVYGVELRASVWTNHVSQSFTTCSDVRRQLKQAFDEAGIPFVQAMIAAEAPPEG